MTDRSRKCASQYMDIEMNDVIQTGRDWAKNKITGAQFKMSLARPIDGCDYWYENPTFGLKIGLHVTSIGEERQVQIQGKMKPWRICLGMILPEGQLRRLVDAGCGTNASEEQKNALVSDCYALMSRYITSFYDLYYTANPDVHFHVYEVEVRRLDPWPHMVGPDAIAALQAITCLLTITLSTGRSSGAALFRRAHPDCAAPHPGYFSP